MGQLKLAHRHVPEDVTVIAVGGELDMATARELDAYIRGARRHAGDHLVFDLGELTFLDSRGLQVLLNTYTYTHARGGTVRLATPLPGPARVIEITQIATRIPVHTGTEEAITAALSAIGHGDARPESEDAEGPRQETAASQGQGTGG